MHRFKYQSGEWPPALSMFALGLCGLTFLIAFMEPSVGGLPIGDRQLAQFVPDAVESTLGSASRLSIMLTVSVGAALAALRVFQAKMVAERRHIVNAVSLMAGAVAIGAAWGIVGESETRYALAHGQFVVPYVVALGMPIPTRWQWTRLVSVMRIGFTLPAAYTAVVVAINSGEQLEWYNRIIPNGVSFCGLGCLFWLAYGNQTKRRWSYGLAVACGWAVVISSARGWILALIIGLVAYVVMGRRSSGVRPWRWIGGGALLTVLASPLLARTGPVSSLIERTRRDLTSGAGLRGRQVRTLITEWIDSPLLGSGLGYRNPELARGWRTVDIPRPYLVELSYLNLLAKLGIFGFGLLVAGMAVALVYLHRAAVSSVDDPAILVLYPATLYLLLTSLVNPTFESVYVHLFIAVALLGARAAEEPAWIAEVNRESPGSRMPIAPWL